MKVVLSPAELRYAALAGVDRRLSAMQNARRDRYGEPAHNLWGEDIEACAGELAVAKLVGAYWIPVARSPTPGDVGSWEVRTTWRPDGSLIVHEGDADEAVFVLATGTSPTFDVTFWAYGREAKRSEFWRENVPRPAFFMPQDEMRMLDKSEPPPPFEPPEGVASDLWQLLKNRGLC